MNFTISQDRIGVLERVWIRTIKVRVMAFKNLVETYGYISSTS
jgi:hypothetical protein